MLNDAETAIAILEDLAARGVSISLDDFGTGYSSLAYLQRLPVDELKIDKSFVFALSSEDPTAASLLRSITSLGHNLGLRMVAEGVEDATQMAVVRDLGCQLGQGYHFARPLPAAAFAAWLARHNGAPLRLLQSTA
jgi:EAL domain-containing protein (putative c-di-GMP-specific phosphodiesterase class I)